MSAFCKYCNINWAALYDVPDGSGENEVSVCPKCLNDRYLTDKVAGVAWIMCPIEGRIYDPETNETYIGDQKKRAAVKPAKAIEHESRAHEMRMEELQDRQLEAYIAALADGKSLEEAYQIWKQII